MTATRALILIGFTITMTLLATLFAYAGYQAMEVGYGLNPMIAFPFACLCFVVVGAFWWWMLADDRDDAAYVRQTFGLDSDYTIDYVELRS